MRVWRGFFFLSDPQEHIFLRYVNLFSSCSGLIRENQLSRPVFSDFSGLARLFLPPRPARADFSFLFPSCNGIFGSHKSFFLLRTRSRLTSSSILPLTRKKQKTGHLSNCKKIASDRLEKNCTWQAEKTTGAFCAGCPYISHFKVLFFLQTSFLSALWLSALPPCQVLITCSSSLLLLICCLHCRHAKSKNDPLSRSGLTP